METIVFLGDSITDANRLDSPNGLGYGYVNQIAGRLHRAGKDWAVYNKGVDGFIAQRLVHNLPADCLSYRPDLVSILIGINDVGIIMNTTASHQDRLYILEDCLRAYHQMLFDITQATPAHIFTLEPFLFPWPLEYKNWLPWQHKLSKQIQKLSRNYGAVFVPLHDRLNEAAKKQGYEAVTTDGIHLTETGHTLLCEALWEAMQPFL